MAHHLGKGLVLIRKDGKLPGATIGVDYALEYGTDRIVMHEDACVPGQKRAAGRRSDRDGRHRAAPPCACSARPAPRWWARAFVIDLPDLGGADKLRAEGVPVTTLVSFEGD